MSRLTGEVREAAKKSRLTGEVREAAKKSRLTGEVREATEKSRLTGEVREATEMSRLTGEVREAAKPDPRFEDPMDRSERRRTRSETEWYGRILADRAEDLEKALRRENVKQINRTASITEAALADVERSIDTEAAAGEMSPEELDWAKEEHRAPVRELFKRAREVKWQVAAAEWTRKARATAVETRELAEAVLEDEYPFYTIQLVEYELLDFTRMMSEIGALLTTGADAGFADCKMCREVCPELRTGALRAEEAVKRLIDIRAELITALPVAAPVAPAAVGMIPSQEAAQEEYQQEEEAERPQRWRTGVCRPWPPQRRSSSK